MKVLIAGATGTLGLPLVHELVAKNDQVIGLTRSTGKREMLEQAGATAVVADALDGQALNQALASTTPDAVVDLLTAIPKNGPTSPSFMKATNELRVRGTANLLQAAISAGVKRIVAESMIFAYGFGDHGPVAQVESGPLQTPKVMPALQETVDSVRSLEDQMLEANAQGLIEAVPLRYGLIYGPDPTTQYMLRLLGRRLLPTLSGADGIASWIYTSDAVRATMAALELGRAGEIYNVVDDTPVSFNDWLRDAARLLGAKPPFSIPVWLVRPAMPHLAVIFSTRLPVSNQKAKRELQWQLQFPSYREGLRQAVAAYENSNAAPGQVRMRRRET